MPFTDLQPFVDAIDLNDKLFQQKVKILQLAKQINNENLVDPAAPYTTNNLRDLLQLMLEITQGIEAEARVIMPPKPKPSFIQRIRKGTPARSRAMSASFNYGLASLAITKADRVLKNNKAMHADYVDAVEQCARSLKKLMEQIGATSAPPQRRRAASVAKPPKPQATVTDLLAQVLTLLTDAQTPENINDPELQMLMATMNLPTANKPPIKFTIVPPPAAQPSEDIDNATRKRRQEKVLNKKTHIQRAKTGVGKEANIIDDWKTLATILGDDIVDAYSNRGISRNLSGDYDPAAVNQNMLDKQAVFGKLGCNWDNDDHTTPFVVKFHPDNEPEVQLLDILPTVDARTKVQEITLTQHSYLNVGHAATTEMLAKAADCMHAQHVEISCVDAAGKVFLPGIVEGVKNALYANLIPVLDQATQLALAAYVKSAAHPHPQVVSVQNICDLCRIPNNAAQVFLAFETALAGFDPTTGAKVGFVDEPYSSVRKKRKL